MTDYTLMGITVFFGLLGTVIALIIWRLSRKTVKGQTKVFEKEKLKINDSVMEFYKIYLGQKNFNMQSIRVMTGIIFPIAILVFAEVIAKSHEINFLFKLGVAFISIFLMTIWYLLIKNWGLDGYVLRGVLEHIEDQTEICNLKAMREITDGHKDYAITQHIAYPCIVLVFSFSWFFYLITQAQTEYVINSEVTLDWKSNLFAIILVACWAAHFGYIIGTHQNSTIKRKDLKPEIEKRFGGFVEQLKAQDKLTEDKIRTLIDKRLAELGIVPSRYEPKNNSKPKI